MKNARTFSVVDQVVDVSNVAGLNGSSFHFRHDGALVAVGLQKPRIAVKLHQLEYLSLEKKRKMLRN